MWTTQVESRIVTLQGGESLSLLIFVMALTAVQVHGAGAADTSCTFMAQGEAVEIKIVVDKRVIWDGLVLKDERQTVSIPQGGLHSRIASL
jgi:hypothetical protein